MTTNPTSEPLIKVNLGPEGGIIGFNTYDEFVNWFNGERSAWSWIFSAAVQFDKSFIETTLNQFQNNIQNQIAITIQLIRQAAAANQTANISEFITTVWSNSERYYVNNGGIFSGSPNGKFILNLKEKQGEGVALSAMGYLNRRMMGPTLQGSISAFLFENGMYKTAISEKAALDALATEWRANLESLRTETKENQRKLKVTNDNVEKWLEHFTEEFKKRDSDSILFHTNFLNETNEKSEKFYLQAQTDWSNLKKTYDAELAIRAPVRYWRERAVEHRNLSWIFGGVSLGVGAIIFVSIWNEIKEMMSEPPNLPHPELWHPEYWRLGLLISSGLFGVWVIKIFVRLFLNNMQMLTDAKERVTMVQTYLALIRRGKLSPESESFVLQALFKSSNPGQMKDDGAPASTFEILSKLGKSE